MNKQIQHIPTQDANRDNVAVDTPFFNWLLMTKPQGDPVKAIINYLGLNLNTHCLTQYDVETLKAIYTYWVHHEIIECFNVNSEGFARYEQ